MTPKVSVVIPVYNVDKYIRKMLTSVKEQTFTDYEVIIINDGSTDDSQSIIEEFCKTDKRFKFFYQHNQGVAAARNKGIFESQGEYIVFYDPDDFIPRKAISALYRSVTNNNADMSIGIMKEVSAGESRCNGHTINLSKKGQISRFDKELLWSFSVCNKIFKREMIRKNNIIFPELKHAEDAVFLFKCIFASKKISGCKTVVYEYQFRNFWEGRSATQIITSNYLTDVINALDMLEIMIIEQTEMVEESEKSTATDFLKEFYMRYIHISLLNGYYRQLWNSDETLLSILKEKVNELSNKISSEQWDRIVSDNRDLQLENNLYEKDEVAQKALLTFVIPKDLDSGSLELMLNSIYNQSMPSFRVLINQDYRDSIDKKMIKENMVFTCVYDLETIDTEFVVFPEKGIVFSKNTIRIMLNLLLKNKQLDYVTAPIKKYSNGRYFNTSQAAAFTTLQCMSNRVSKYDALDDMMGNKVFRRTNIDKSYDSMNGKKIYNAYMILFGNEVIKDYDKLSKVSVSIKLKYKAVEDWIIGYIKNRYTKEDIKRIIKREI